MSPHTPQRALVLGRDATAAAAADLLRARGARVWTAGPEAAAVPGLEAGPAGGAPVDLVVMGADVPASHPLARALRGQGVDVISELELGFRHSLCLHLAVAGAAGKTTAARMLAAVLGRAQRGVASAGDPAVPLSALVRATRELEFVVVEVPLAALEGVAHFRPVVAVLLNLAPADGAPRRARDRARRAGRLFANQQCFDWAVVQSEALAQLRAADVALPSKVITFSARNRRADLWWDRGLVQSRLPDWTGPLLDMARGQVRGPQNAENLMAALAVGHILRVPLEAMAATLAAVPPEPGCCESLGEIAGVEFVNDARSTSPLTLQAAIQAARPGRRGEPNVLLIAGGRDQELDFHDLGPLLSQRVKRAFLLDGAAPRLRAAWSLFTPCAVVSSLLEAVRNAFDAAAVGDVVLFSPACFDSDTFPTPPHRGAAFRRAVGEFRDNPGPRRPTVPGPDPDGRPDLRAAESMPFVTFAHTDQQRPDR